MSLASAGKPSRSTKRERGQHDSLCPRDFEHTLNKPRNTILDSSCTRTSTVGTDRTNCLQKPFCPSNNVALVSKLVQQNVLLLQQWWVFQQAQDLSEKCDWLLVELLWVSNVGRNDLGERKIGIALCQLGSVLLGSNSEFSSHSIFCLLNVGVDVVDVQAAKTSGRRHGSM